MKFLTVFFAALFLGSLVARIVFGVYAADNPIFAGLADPFTYVCVGFGAIMVGLVVSIIIRGFKK